VKHFKVKGILSRACSKCGGDLADRYGKQRYCRKCHAEHMRLTRPKHTELSEQSRLKASARAYTKEYLKRGKIQREPCKKCGSEDSQIHHLDYNKPLLIEWYCRKCHLEIHK